MPIIRNFDKSCFKLKLPLIEKCESIIKIKSEIIFKHEYKENVVLVDIILKKHMVKREIPVNKYFECLMSFVKFELNIDADFRINNSELVLIFITSSGTRNELTYKIDNSLKVTLNNILFENVGINEYLTQKTKCNNKNINTSKIFNDYRNAIADEMLFIKENGKKHKVTDGEYIDNVNGMYAYAFNLESEFFINESSPITLHFNGFKFFGTTLFCEGFKIALLIDNYCGVNINHAYISAEPWKILHSLLERLDKLNKNNIIANKLLGYKNDNKNTINDIAKGQDEALKRAINDEITIIWGPPGTGKTYTMAKIAINHLKNNKRILMVSHSNISVDGFMNEFYKQIKNSEKDVYLNFVKHGKTLRYGYIRDKKLLNNNQIVAFNYALVKCGLKERQEELIAEKNGIKDIKSLRFVEIEKELNNIKCIVRNEEKNLAYNASLLATTISKVCIDNLFDDIEYDVVMFDEVSMAYVPQVILASMYAKKHFVCVGDFRQLSPISQSKSKNILCNDIFNYLGIVNKIGDLFYHPWLVMLNEQRRMHPEISKFSREYIYHNLLLDHASTGEKTQQITNAMPFKKMALTLIDLSCTNSITSKNNDNSRFNLLSALISYKTAMRAIKSGEKSIGIITPYVAQSRLIQSMIIDSSPEIKNYITCSTVHQFQGSERNVVIFDAVECYPMLKPGTIMNKNENNSIVRLINVALTRSKGKFIVVANYDYWKSRSDNNLNIFVKFLDYMHDNSNVVGNEKLISYLNEIAKIGLSNIYTNYDLAYKEFKKCLFNIKYKILLCANNQAIKDEKDIRYILKELDDYGIEILGKTNYFHALDEGLKDYFKQCDDICLPMIIIDDAVLYYGLPHTVILSKIKNTTQLISKPVFFRISGSNVIKIIKSLSDVDYITNGAVRNTLVSSKLTHVNKDGIGGLLAYIECNYECHKCKNPLTLTFGKNMIPYLKCTNKKCSSIEYLTIEIVNDYIKKNNLTCPDDNGEIEAKLGTKGIYIKCSKGHFLKVTKI